MIGEFVTNNFLTRTFKTLVSVISFSILIPSLIFVPITADGSAYTSFYITACVLVLGRLVDYCDEIVAERDRFHLILYCFGICASIIAASLSLAYAVCSANIPEVALNIMNRLEFILVFVTMMVDVTIFLLLLFSYVKNHSSSVSITSDSGTSGGSNLEVVSQKQESYTNSFSDSSSVENPLELVEVKS